MKYRSIIVLSTILLACATKTGKTDGTQGAAPLVGGDGVTVKLADASQAQTVELICGDGSYRSSQAVSAGVTKFGGVPAGQCTLDFKGGIPAKFTPVSRGKSYHCSIIGQTAVCKGL